MVDLNEITEVDFLRRVRDHLPHGTDIWRHTERRIAHLTGRIYIDHLTSVRTTHGEPVKRNAPPLLMIESDEGDEDDERYERGRDGITEHGWVDTEAIELIPPGYNRAAVLVPQAS